MEGAGEKPAIYATGLRLNSVQLNFCIVRWSLKDLLPQPLLNSKRNTVAIRPVLFVVFFGFLQNCALAVDRVLQKRGRRGALLSLAPLEEGWAFG